MELHQHIRTAAEILESGSGTLGERIAKAAEEFLSEWAFNKLPDTQREEYEAIELLLRDDAGRIEMSAGELAEHERQIERRILQLDRELHGDPKDRT